MTRLLSLFLATCAPVPAFAGGPPACICPTDGARQGEDLDARIERLERELRLSKAERVVNKRNRKDKTK